MKAEERRRGLKYFVWPVLALLALVVARETIGARTDLVTYVPTAWRWLCYGLGVFVGLPMAVQFARLNVPGEPKWKQIALAMFIVPVAIVMLSYIGRWGFEAAAFVNVQTEPKLTQVKIMDVAGGGRSAGHRLDAKAFPDGREFNVFVTARVRDKIAAIQPPLRKVDFKDQPFCIDLSLEQGRWGAVRAHVPARWDKGIGTFRICGGVTIERSIITP